MNRPTLFVGIEKKKRKKSSIRSHDKLAFVHFLLLPNLLGFSSIFNGILLGKKANLYGVIANLIQWCTPIKFYWHQYIGMLMRVFQKYL